MDSEKTSAWPKVIGAILVLVVAIAAYRSMGSKEEPVEYETVKLERKTVEAYVAAGDGTYYDEVVLDGTSITVFDSLGIGHTLSGQFERQDDGTWSVWRG